MNTVAIDRNTINDLFDNQKKMDELFDSIFDEHNYFITSSSSSPQAGGFGSTYDEESQFSYEVGSVTDSLLAKRRHSPAYFVLPIVLEIAAIYLIITKLL